MPEFIVNGIVSARDEKPYIQLGTEDGVLIQLTLSQARSIAMDILVQASRAETDAMVHKFFTELEANDTARGAAMHLFREYRAQLDAEEVERSMGPPPEGSGG